MRCQRGRRKAGPVAGRARSASRAHSPHQHMLGISFMPVDGAGVLSGEARRLVLGLRGQRFLASVAGELQSSHLGPSFEDPIVCQSHPSKPDRHEAEVAGVVKGGYDLALWRWSRRANVSA